MKIEFTYSRFDHSSSVRLNGRPAGGYSSFARCQGQPFFSWFEKLPEYCRNEANEPYHFVFNGSPLESMMLKKLFEADHECITYSSSDEFITIDDRMKWVRDLKPYLNSPVKVRIGIDSENAQKNAAAIRSFLNPYTAESVEVVCERRSADIVFTKDSGRSSGYAASSHPVCLITPGASDASYAFSDGNCHVFKADFRHMEDFLNLWLDETIYPKLFRKIQKSALNKADTLTAKKKDMLTAGMPFLALQISSAKIELSETAVWSVIRLPENHPCTVKTDNDHVIRLSGSSSLVPLQEGTAHLTVSSLRIPSLKDTREIKVCRYYRITDLTLSMPAAAVIKGQQFQVNLKYTPSNAMNTSDIRWNVSDAKALHIVRSGKNQAVFLAAAAGKHTVSVRAGSVHQSLTVNVLPAAEKIILNSHDLKLKQKEKGVFLRYSILPSNAAKANVCYDLSDPSVMSISAATGEIAAHREGMCILSAVLLDQNGRPVHEDRCTVTVLPAKDVYSPALYDACALIALMCVLVSENPELMFPAALICALASVYGCFKTTYRWQYWLYGSFIALSILIPVLKIYAR